MKRAIEGTTLAIILALANVVAGGVTVLIAPLVPMGDDPGVTEVAAIGIIMAVAVFCAICFIEGAIAQAKRYVERTRP